MSKCKQSPSVGVATSRGNENVIYGLTQEISNSKVVRFIRKLLKKYGHVN